MRFIGLIVILAWVVPLAANAQSICYACHAAHGDIWRGDPIFHRQGVGHCSLCHTMHNSQGGFPVADGNPAGVEFLLKGNPTDVCLTCHGGTYGNVFGTDPQSPPYQTAGGNFAFLLEDNINDRPGGGIAPIPGEACGHNVISPDRGVSQDGTLSVSPGGSFPSDQLGCTSCHDPHGNQNFRMLNGVGEIQAGLFTFNFPAPDAQGLSIYHGQESPSRHSAYRSGMSQWCANCHENFLEPGLGHRHPVDVPLGTEIAARYNAYNGTDDPEGSTPATAYVPEVPFEDPTSTTSSQSGPSAASRVMCLTCHRAHGSSAPDAMRWDPNVTFLSADGVESGSYPLPSPYPHQAQRSLCNKCHYKDFQDTLVVP